MSRYDAERALDIYKVFTKQTAEVVDYLQHARVVEPSTRLQIPNIKHAPTSLTSSLEEYLHDPDFDINRRQYLAAQEAKSSGSKTNATTTDKPATATASVSKPAGAPKESFKDKEQPKIAPDLIDFFESIETEQTPMFPNTTGPQIQLLQTANVPPMPTFVPQPGTQFGMTPSIPMQTGGQFPLSHTGDNFQQSTMPNMASMQPIQVNFTGAGFGGFGPQEHQITVSAPQQASINQQLTQSFAAPDTLQQSHQGHGLQIPQVTGTNPFRQSMLMTSGQAMSPPTNSPISSQTKSTNPFARHTGMQIEPPSATPLVGVDTGSPVSSVSARPMTVTGTGTNPFARNISPQLTGNANLAVPAGAGSPVTNPFRASVMMQQQQAQYNAQLNGNFSGQTGSMGGLENLDTIPVFPRTQTGTGGWGT